MFYVLVVVETQKALLWHSRPFSPRLYPLGQEQVYFGEWSLICGAGRQRYSHPPFSVSSSHQFLPSQEGERFLKIGIAVLTIYTPHGAKFAYSVSPSSESNIGEECVSLMLDGCQSLYWKHTLKIPESEVSWKWSKTYIFHRSV